MKTFATIGATAVFAITTGYCVGHTLGPWGLIFAGPVGFLIGRGTRAIADEVFI